MFYQKEVLVPALTSFRDPVEEVLTVDVGVVTHVWVGFPRRCCGLVHVQIWHQGWQTWPWTARESYHWDDYMFEFDDHYPLAGEPFEFVIKAWSRDDFYDHNVTVAVMLQESSPVRRGFIQRLMGN